jgi:hypothetical protein
LVILTECVAFGGGKDQVAAPVAQRTVVRRDRELPDPIGSPGATTIARESGAVSHPDLHSSDLQDSVCLMIEAAGRAHGLPPEFFVRIIWQESRFRPSTVGPRRPNGERAQGIAQFMPSTAAEKGLLDPFDPVQALPKAAQFLRELADQFGSLGLAAAAYNAGPARVRAWLAGERKLSAETRNYVVAITGVPADEWARAGTPKPAMKTSPSCGELMALLQQPASPQGTRLSLRDEPMRFPDTQLAKNDLVAAPLIPLRGDLWTPPEALSSRGDIAMQPASSSEPPPSSRDEPAQSPDTQLAKNDLVAAPLTPLRGDLWTPPEAPSSRGDIAKQPALSSEPAPLSRDEPAQSPDTQLAKNDPVAAPLGPGRADPESADRQPSSTRGNTSLFMEKLTERVNLVADSQWGIQLSAGFSRERVLAAYATIASRYAGILAGRDASILSSVFHSRGTGVFYQIRVGTDTFETAESLCAEIRSAGGACMVLRNHS